MRYCTNPLVLIQMYVFFKILKLRFNKDQRVEEVRRLLQSNEPVPINIVQRPEVSDHEFIEEQERYLYAISTRTMALPVGRLETFSYAILIGLSPVVI